MTRQISKLSPLVRWQYLRWVLVLPALPLALWACNSHRLQEPLPNPQQETDFKVVVSPEREVDILFMIDNSPSMDPKQTALATNFPKMIQVLQNLPDPSNPGKTSLPDVHIGVISSDMGAGSDNIGGNCSRVLGDRGLLWGNDPNNNIASVAAGNTLYSSASGQSPNYPTPNGCGLASGARWIIDVANANGAGRTQNYTGNLTDVFSCLARSVGIAGCGYEHQLQSIRVALNPQQVNCDTNGQNCTDINMENVGFLRDNAYLAIILISDEDDDSAPVPDTSKDGNDNDGMFLNRPPGETASMKAAMRGHLCGGQPIPGYDPANGFTPQNPAPTPNVGPGTGVLGFMHPFSDCTDKEQIDRAHPDSAYLPLIDVRDIIDSVNGVKRGPRIRSSCLASSAGPRTLPCLMSKPRINTGSGLTPPRSRPHRTPSGTTCPFAGIPLSSL